MDDFSFVTSSTRFKCQRCAKCCSLDVMLSDNEMKRLGGHADEKWRTTKKVWRGATSRCILLKDMSCAIYLSRPKLCRVYPFLAVLASDFSQLNIPCADSALRITWEDGKSYFIIYDDACPGVGKGDVCDWNEEVALTVSHINDFAHSQANP